MVYRGDKNKNPWSLFLLMLAGLVIFGFLGSFLREVPILKELVINSLDFSIGDGSPVIIDLHVIELQFGLTLKLTVMSVIGMGLGIFVYKKI